MEIGLAKARIFRNAIETITTKEGDKPAVVLYVGVGEEEESARITIWLTPAALSIAFKHLETCGFDPDKEDFAILVEKPDRLAGKEVDVIVEQRGNYWNVSLPLGNPPPSRQEINRIGRELKAVRKSKGEPKAPLSAPEPVTPPPPPCSVHGIECTEDCLDRIPF